MPTALTAGPVPAADEFPSLAERDDPLWTILEQQKQEIHEYVLRTLILHNYAKALDESLSWRALAPLRWLRRQFRPRGFTAEHLLPWAGLEPDAGAAPGTWKALDTDPQFVVSCCLPAGWVRVRLTMRAPARGQIEFYAEHRGDFGAETLLGQFSLAHGDNDDEFFLHLARPTRALRIDPFDAAGTFHIDRLEVTPRPAWTLAFDALRRKLRLLKAYRNTGPVLRRGLALLLTGRWGQVAAKWRLGLDDPRCTRHGFYESEAAYEDWIERRRLTAADRAAHRAWADDLADPPRISVLMPTFETPERLLRLAIESVRRQTYPHWELCIADDGSTAPHVRAVLDEYAAQDDRIQVAPPAKHGGIAAASNAALELATGDYIALLDHDDELAEHAFYRMAQAIVADPTADMLYSDEDKLLPDGSRKQPFFKPDWSPEFFLGCMYTCHLGLYRTALVRAMGGFRPEFDGAQDYDLVLRLSEQTDRIVHVPDVLYHWRLVPGSTSTSVAAKPHALSAGLRALEEHLERTGRPGRAVVGPSAGLNWVRFDVVGQPKVSIIIPTLGQPYRDARRPSEPDRPAMIERCAASIARVSRYKRYEVIVLDRHTMPPTVERCWPTLASSA